MHLGTEGQ